MNRVHVLIPLLLCLALPLRAHAADKPTKASETQALQRRLNATAVENIELKLKAIQSEGQALEARFTALASQLAKVTAERDAADKALREQLGLAVGDKINDDGSVTKAPAVAKADKPPKK